MPERPREFAWGATGDRVRIASVAALGGFLFGYDSAVITAVINIATTIVAIALIDRIGRKPGSGWRTGSSP